MRRVGAALLWFATAAGLGAQTEGGVLASLPASTRGAALGGTGAAITGAAAAILANPAAAASLHGLALEGSHERYLVGTTVSAIAAAGPVGPVAWALGVQTLDYGSEPEIVPDAASGGRRGTPTGATFGAGELLAVAGAAYAPGPLAVGAAVKYARRDVADWDASEWTGDIGVTVVFAPRIVLGASVQNLGSDRFTRLGAVLDWQDARRPWRLLAVVEGQWPAGLPGRAAVGIEGGVERNEVTVVGRLGYSSQSEGSAASPVTIGGGVGVGRFALDYAYRAYDTMGGGTHRVGLRWTR